MIHIILILQQILIFLHEAKLLRKLEYQPMGIG